MSGTGESTDPPESDAAALAASQEEERERRRERHRLEERHRRQRARQDVLEQLIQRRGAMPVAVTGPGAHSVVMEQQRRDRARLEVMARHGAQPLMNGSPFPPGAGPLYFAGVPPPSGAFGGGRGARFEIIGAAFGGPVGMQPPPGAFGDVGGGGRAFGGAGARGERGRGGRGGGGGDGAVDLTHESEDSDVQNQRAIFQSLVQQAASSNDAAPRERALRALAEAAAVFDPYLQHVASSPFAFLSPREFFEEASVALLAGAAEAAAPIREQAILALGKLARDGNVAGRLWTDEHGARASILAAAAEGQAEGVRYAAHYALSLIVIGRARLVWAHEPAREVILRTIRPAAGARSAAAVRVREEAFDSLLNSITQDAGQPRSAARPIVHLLWHDVVADGAAAAPAEAPAAAAVATSVAATLGAHPVGPRAIFPSRGTLQEARLPGSPSAPTGLGIGAYVRETVVAVCADAAEPVSLRKKALEFLKRVVQVGGREARGVAALGPGAVAALLACAVDPEPSGVCVREAALDVLCSMLRYLDDAADVHAAFGVADASESPAADTSAAAAATSSTAAAAAASSTAASASSSSSSSSSPEPSWVAVMAALSAAADGRYDVRDRPLPSVLDAKLRSRCAAEHDRLDMLDPSHRGAPFRTRPRYADLPLEQRLAKLRAIWERRADRAGGGPAPPEPLLVPVRVGSICEDLISHIGELTPARLAASRNMVRFELDHGADAGGLARHVFSDVGNGLLSLVGVSATGEALAAAKRAMRHWHPAMTAQPGQEAELLRQLRAIVGAADLPPSLPAPAASPASAASPAGGAEAETAAEVAAGADAEAGSEPPPAKRARTAAQTPSAPPVAAPAAGSTPMPMAPLFKLTESGALTPSGCETLMQRVGGATADGTLLVPAVNKPTLARYRAVGRVCALALANRMTVGLPFARHFLRLVLGEPPLELSELQAEAEAEDPSFLSGPYFLRTSLCDIGMADCLQFKRQTTSCGHAAPLSHDPEALVTDADKEVYLRRYLEHQLVRTIEAQAAAFREGVEDVLGTVGLSLLSPDELKHLWGGHEIDDERLAAWKARTRVGETPAPLVELFWQYMEAESPAKRAQVLQFATGAARLPSDSEMGSGWTFSLAITDDYPVIQPTESNGLDAPAMCCRASTCSKTLYLPPFDDLDALRRGIDCSLMDGGFGVR